MKKTKLFLLILIAFIIVFAASCTPAPNEPREVYLNNCALFVNGKDISWHNYVFLDSNNQQAELPVLAVARELGAKTEKTAEKAFIIYDGGESEFDLAQADFGWWILPGEDSSTRRIINGEIVIDDITVSYFFKNVFSAKITNLYEQKVVRIDSGDTVLPYEYNGNYSGSLSIYTVSGDVFAKFLSEKDIKSAKDDAGKVETFDNTGGWYNRQEGGRICVNNRMIEFCENYETLEAHLLAWGEECNVKKTVLFDTPQYPLLLYVETDKGGLFITISEIENSESSVCHFVGPVITGERGVRVP